MNSKSSFNAAVFICLAFALAVAGCMDDANTKVTDSDGYTLNLRHTGWGSSDCAACHPKSTFLETGTAADEIHSILKFSDDEVYYGGCRSCHGENGEAMDNSGLTACVLCHSDSVRFIGINGRFTFTHSKSADLTWPGDDCRVCHNVEFHPSKNTSLYTMPDSACLNCHSDHGEGLGCAGCHSQDGGFYRDTDGNIRGHKAGYQN